MAYVSDTGGGGRLGDLFAGLARDFTGLFRTEIELAKAEASEKIDQAVKAGDPLTPDQIAALLTKRHLVDRSSNCPHGRPTTLKLSLRDLEKQFKRTGF